MRPVRPEFVPDPALSREEMAAMQREIAAEATFEDDLPFDPAVVGLEAPVETDVPGEQSPLDDASSADRDGADGSAWTGGDDDDAPIVAGVDQAFLEERAVSGIVALRGDRIVERAFAVEPLSIPYVPGLLSFREGRPILAAFETLAVEPDLVLFDGSGRIHFRQAGLATHLGVALDVPSVGVAKGLLCGRPREPLDALPDGARVAIEADGRVEDAEGVVLGYAVQTRQFESSRRINPVYVSPGHRVGAETAADLVRSLAAGYKLPEPTRLADAYVGAVKAALDEGR